MDLIEQTRQNLRDALRYIKDRVVGEFDVGIILGSGLGGLAEAIERPNVLLYDEIPHFPRSTTKGHAGNLVLGKLNGKNVAVMQGRFHYYEGYTSAGVSFPIKVLRGLGVKTLIVTCAAGGMRSDLKSGDIMAIIDHVNAMGINPLIGPNDDTVGPRFVDMSEAYSSDLVKIAQEVSKGEGIDLKEGVYVAVLGPTYETPAEKRILSIAADAVGMSVVPEVITARHLGMSILGLAVITNTFDGGHAVDHEDVLAEASKSSDKLVRLIIDILGRI